MPSPKDLRTRAVRLRLSQKAIAAASGLDKATVNRFLADDGKAYLSSTAEAIERVIVAEEAAMRQALAIEPAIEPAGAP